MRLVVFAALAPLLLASCSGVREPTGPSRPLAPGETQVVRKKSAEAVAQKEWAVAWDQEVEAGADRARLEEITLSAMAADSGPYEDMVAALQKKFGGFTDAALARATALAHEFEGKGDFSRAVDIQLLIANDPPEYKAAWDLYGRAPVKKAGAVVDAIQKARKAWDEDHAKASK
jgi:hypothetical protein